MWGELMIASSIDRSVIEKSEIMYLDVDINHGLKYGHTVVWKKPEDVPQFFLAYSSPEGQIVPNGSATSLLRLNSIPQMCRWKWM